MAAPKKLSGTPGSAASCTAWPAAMPSTSGGTAGMRLRSPLSGRKSSGASRATRMGRLFWANRSPRTVVGLISRLRASASGAVPEAANAWAAVSVSFGRRGIEHDHAGDRPAEPDDAPRRRPPGPRCRGWRRPRARRRRGRGRPGSRGSPRPPPSRGPSASAVARGRRRPGRARRGSRGGTCSGSRRARRGRGRRPRSRRPSCRGGGRRLSRASRQSGTTASARARAWMPPRSCGVGNPPAEPEHRQRDERPLLLDQVRAGEAADRRVAPAHVPGRLRPLGEARPPVELADRPPATSRTARRTARRP